MPRSRSQKLKQLLFNVLTGKLKDKTIENLFHDIDTLYLDGDQEFLGVTCVYCNTVDEFYLQKNGPHIQAICNHCNRHIQFLSKQFLNNKNKSNMKSDEIIHLRVNVNKINKAWLFKGEKGLYLDITFFYHKEKDTLGQNGMIVQSVPTNIYKAEVAAQTPKDKMSRGEILGNGFIFESAGADAESRPGYYGGASETKASAPPPPPPPPPEEDLPF